MPRVPRKCTVCQHDNCLDIEKMFTAGKHSMKEIARLYGVGYESLRRHLRNHLAARMIKMAEKKELAGVGEIIQPLIIRKQQVEMMLDACHEYLIDPENPNRYYLGPRSEDVDVVYLDNLDGKPVIKRATLSELLEKTGRTIISTRYRHADPRKLILEAVKALDGVLMTVSVIAGYVKPADKITNVQVNIMAMLPNVMEALDKYPEAKQAVLKKLEAARAIKDANAGDN